MKQFIVLTAVLPILLVFMLQFVCDLRTNDRIDTIQAVVYAAKEEARQEGCFTEEISDRIKRDIGEALGIPPDSVEVVSDGGVKHRYAAGDDRLIYYTVRVPLDGVMAGRGLFGQGGDGFVYVIDSYTASERI